MCVPHNAPMHTLRAALIALLAVAFAGCARGPIARSPLEGTSGWLQYSEPESAGFSAAKLLEAKEFADSARSAAVMVVHDGHVVAAWGDVERKFPVHSIRKSVVGALYGMALNRGLVRLDATLAQLGIDDIYLLSDREKRATVGDLLAARSGVYHPAAYADAGQAAGRPARDSVEPGTHWFYNNWDFNVAEAILGGITGASIYELIGSWLAAPTGMEDYQASDGFEVLEPSNSRFPAHTFRMSTRDLARLGQLYLNGGTWRGRQLVPRSWVDTSITAHTDLGNGAGYGYLWWTYARGSLPRYPALNDFEIALARGTGGQAMFLIPAADLVVVHRGDTENEAGVSGGAIWSLVERIVAARQERSGSVRLRPLRPEPLRSQLPPPAPPAHYALDSLERAMITGNYALGNATIRLFEHVGRLFINVPGEGEAELYASSRDSFYLPAVPGITLELERSDDRHVCALTLTLGGRPMRATRQ